MTEQTLRRRELLSLMNTYLEALVPKEPERIVVLSMQAFRETERTGPGNRNPYILDVFKIENGLIRFIMAFRRKGMIEIGWENR